MLDVTLKIILLHYEIAAQAGCAERLNHVGFWQASHRLSEVRIRELRDACAEEANSTHACKLLNYGITYLL